MSRENALCEVISISLANPDRTFCPPIGVHGAIQALALTKWSECQPEVIDAEMRILEQLSLTACLDLLKRGIPSGIRQRLLGPSSRDTTTPNFSCSTPDVPEDFLIVTNDRWAANASDEVKRDAVKAIIGYYMHCYLGAFLARGADAVKALHWPADPECNLTIKQRLTLGVVREFIIFKHFPDLKAFWKVFEQINREYQSHITFFDPVENFERPRVHLLLAGDRDALAMYEAILDMTLEPLNLYQFLGDCDQYRMLPLHHTIDIPKELRQFMQC